MIKSLGIGLIFFHIILFCSGQSNDLDSLRSELQNTTDPLKRFDLLNNILLDITSFRGNQIDSAATLEMLSIAQTLNSDSLRAISYNWLGSFFYQHKGDNSSALEYYFKALPLAEKTGEKRRISSLYFDMALVYFDMLENESALEVTRKGGDNLPARTHPLYDFMLLQYLANMTQYFLVTKNPDSALYYAMKSRETSVRFNDALSYVFLDYSNLGAAYALNENEEKASQYFNAALEIQDSFENISTQHYFFTNYIQFLIAFNQMDKALLQSKKLMNLGLDNSNDNLTLAGARFLRDIHDALSQIDSAYYYAKLADEVSAKIFSQENKNKVQALIFNNRIRNIEEENKQASYRNQVKLYGLMGGIGTAILISFFLLQNNRQKRKANASLQIQRDELQLALVKLESTQSQLIHSEKMASLGELTAGIAHEIQNPLNFVNNFSEINKEMLSELREAVAANDQEEVEAILKNLEDNEDKVTHHGKRAEQIVKSMLQHSRTGSGEKELTDINALCDEYLRLSYHGYRAKDKSFNADFKTVLDPALSKINVVPQDIGRVLLNLINNAFQAVKDCDHPEVIVTTSAINEHIEITVSDNGLGIPDDIKDKVFQPFFTTKPTGEGTGLGLSMSYDIITKGHGGKIDIVTEQGKGTKFIVQLPLRLA